MDYLPHLTPLLRLSWLAATLPILIASLPLPFLAPLRRLLLLFAGRGKTLKSSASFTLPQRFFTHFYVIALALTTCLILSTWLFYADKEARENDVVAGFGFSDVASHIAGGGRMIFRRRRRAGRKEWRTVFVLVMMEVQVLRRLYESRVVFDYAESARMHVLGYLTGVFFYTAAPLSFASTVAPEALSYASSQMTEYIVKGRERMPPIELSCWELLKPLISLGWCQWIGISIFFWGWLHQLNCHAILGSLREHKGADEYVIPHGDWFEYISCPHYFAEIVIYAGILVASGGLDVTIWLLFFFVVANLVFAAADTHRWYRRKFKNYPPSRRAIIPFVY